VVDVVGPSLTPEERDVANVRLKIGFVLLVTVSAGLVAVQAQATLVQAGLALLAGLALGLGLIWFLGRWSDEFMRSG
jgi:uncharacterized membrane protein